MPWDPKPDAAPRVVNGAAPAAVQGSYHGYDGNAGRIKAEPGSEQYQSNPPPASYAAMQPQQGGMARAQELVEQRFGPQAAAAIHRPGGLALPGQQPKPQGLQLPGQAMAQQQYSQQQQHMLQQQRAALQAQQSNQRIKTENDSPIPPQGQFTQPISTPNYGQTDGPDDLAAWQAMLAQRRALEADRVATHDRMMRDQISALSDELDSGLMMTLQQNQARIAARNRRAARLQPVPEQTVTTPAPHIAQLDGEDDEDDKSNVKLDEDDEDAINSDLDDPEDDQNPIGDDEDELGDTILCTYDKVSLCSIGHDWLAHADV